MTITAIKVPFHGNNLYLVNKGGEPFVPMKPIVEGMGMDWASQFVKLKKQSKKFGCCDIAIPTKGGIQNMLCLPLKKLNGWLFGINPEKVRPDIRDKLIQYQEESFSVLHDYWTKGQVTNPRKAKKALPGKITPEQQEAIKQLVLSRGRSVPHEKQAKAIITLWSSIKSHFGCSYKEIAEDQFTEALSLAARVPLEGEYLPKQPDTLPDPSGHIRGIMALYLVGSEIVRSEFLPKNVMIGTLDHFESLVRHRGGVVLWDEMQQREFVRERAIARL